MGDINKVTTGQKVSFKAETFNTIADTVNLINRSRGRTGAPEAKRGGSGNTIFVKNTSGSDIERGEVLGIDAPIMAPGTNEDEFLARVSFKGVTPDGDDHKGKFIVCADKIKDGDIGRGYIAGTCHAKVDIQAEADEFADIEDGETLLKSGASGAKILWKETGTGEVWTILSLTENSMPAIYKATADQSDGKVTGKRLAIDGTTPGEEEEHDVYYGLAEIKINDTYLLTAGFAGEPTAYPCGGMGEINNPFDLTYSAEHTEAALTDSGWSRVAPTEGHIGAIITMQVGAAFYESTDKKFYAYFRDYTFDSMGQLSLVSAERRQEVFATAQQCDEEGS
jgi:hypothetical protein